MIARMLCLACAGAAACAAQIFTHRGFVEAAFYGYPQTAPGDSGRAIGEALVRYEPALRYGLTFRGSFDTRTDTHRQVERAWDLDYWDRSIQRPAFSIRRLSATYGRGPLTLELGKQFVRWGKTDILNPTDRFAPRDYLNVVENDFLGVTAARLTLANASDSLDLVFTPRMTPSRTPLLNQRWAGLPAGIPLRDAGAVYPGGPQYGARWNRIGRGVEYSVSFFEGYNHLPVFEPTVVPPRVEVRRTYPKLRTWGGDVAAPLPWFTLKAEAAWFQSRPADADRYVLYVVQLERQYGEWMFTGGYTGEKVTRLAPQLDFSPDRGLARAIVGRASYNIDTNRSVVFETVVRQNGEGVYAKLEYSQAIGGHWRVTGRAVVIRGSDRDFLGQYRRNSLGELLLRYSF